MKMLELQISTRIYNIYYYCHYHTVSVTMNRYSKGMKTEISLKITYKYLLSKRNACQSRKSKIYPIEISVPNTSRIVWSHACQFSCRYHIGLPTVMNQNQCHIFDWNWMIKQQKSVDRELKFQSHVFIIDYDIMFK